MRHRVRALDAEFFPRLTSANPVRIKAHDVERFHRECALVREHLEGICGAADLSGQDGLAVDVVTGQAIGPRASPEAFRQLVSRHLANIEYTARRAKQVGGEIEIS